MSAAWADGSPWSEGRTFTKCPLVRRNQSCSQKQPLGRCCSGLQGRDAHPKALLITKLLREPVFPQETHARGVFAAHVLQSKVRGTGGRGSGPGI